jgi:hypothetical protein
MPSKSHRKSHRDSEPSVDFFRQPEAGSNNGVEHPTATDTGEWDVDAMRLENDGPVASTEDAWNLDALRLSQDFDAEVGGKKLLTTVPVRRPKRQEFVRVHHDPAWHLPAALLEVEEDRESYLVVSALQKALTEEVRPVDLVTAMNRSGLLFLWPVKRAKAGKRANAWLTSAQAGARLAQKHWVKVASNHDLAAYEITQAEVHYPDPKWPTDLDFDDLLKLAFKDHVIRDMQHPVLRRLRGEI